MKWLTLNISARRVMGRSLSTDPSIHLASGSASQGTSFPVLRSLAISSDWAYTSGTEHEVQLLLLARWYNQTRTELTYTADHIITFGAVM